ncbi:replication initiator protein A [Clostridium massiliamazoniense]|uniref:replication initiator protein A n=1 Tax=Clostridium massiliamazoniense TaxID=1347366 RepID=UPI0006D7BA17|nr:replication initiator protein A [Clostridium massiliamazoniense]
MNGENDNKELVIYENEDLIEVYENEYAVEIYNKKDLNENFIMDINMIENPMCRYGNSRKVKTVANWLDDPSLSKSAREIIEKVASADTKMEFLSWTDSKGNDREILAISAFKLPGQFAMDVYYALIGLYIKQNSPIKHGSDDKGNKIYHMPENRLRFKISDVCKYMRLPNSGTIYGRIKDSIQELKAVSFYSLGSGAFYDKKKREYTVSKTKTISLIADYELAEVKNHKGVSLADKCEVIFGNLVMDNLTYNYIKFLDDDIYYSLKSGLTRRLYSYITGNMYRKTHIKRSFERLSQKLPLEYTYPSELKRKLKNPLNDLVKRNIISDYFFGNEILVNGIKENALYIIFKGTKKEIIDELEKDKKKKIEPPKQEDESNENEGIKLEFPKDIKKELIDLGINDKKISSLMAQHSKYELAKYILFIKDNIQKGKTKNPAGFFVFAITPGENGNMVNVEKTNPEIVEFIEDYKLKEGIKTGIDEKVIKKAFDKYIEEQLKEFLEDEEYVYNTMRESILSNIELVCADRIKSQKRVYNSATSDKDKESILKSIDKWEKFQIEREESEIFKEMFIKESRLYRKFMEYQEFKVQYINGKIE